MTQFDNPYANPYMDPTLQPRKNSGLAITALVFSLIVCCPVTTLLGPILGVIAFVSIGSNPGRKGKGLAVTAIIIGIAATALWVVGGLYVRDKIAQFMETMTHAPNTAMTAGFAGDAAAFKAQFYGAGATAPDADVTAFISSAQTRYGKFDSALVDQQAQPGSPPMGQPSIVLPYTFKFANQSLPADVEIVIVDQKTGQWVWKLGSIVIKDPTMGDLAYPTGAKASPTRAGSSSSGSSRPSRTAPPSGDAAPSQTSPSGDADSDDGG